MTQTALPLKDASGKAGTSSVSPQIHNAPVTDIEAFIASFPKFTDQEAQALEEAVFEDRAQRRAFVESE